MRKLSKGSPPEILADNGDAWTNEYSSGPTANYARYRHRDIRSALADETLSKCAYCESRIEDVAPSHVEHIIPKSVRPDLVVDWRNLTIACPNCNTYKGAYYSATQPLLDPYRDNPRKHLLFAGSLLFSHGESDLGERTIIRMRLSRTELNQSRELRLKSLNELYRVWYRASANDKEMYAALLLEEVGPDREYSEAGRTFLQHMGFPVPYEE